VPFPNRPLGSRVRGNDVDLWDERGVFQAHTFLGPRPKNHPEIIFNRNTLPHAEKFRNPGA
ncbi:MAG: hypothetical protein LUC93_10975, partial [Planctomycetaceae bacterium]|nr:hypothetical protein [Planctomycetaceae bacterium]